MIRNFRTAVFVVVVVLTTSGVATAADPTIGQNTAAGQVDGNDVSFPVSGRYNGQNFAVGKVIIVVKRTDADGVSNPVVYPELQADLVAGRGNSGEYSGTKTVPYVQGKKYFTLVKLYNNANQLIAQDGYQSRSITNP